MKDKAIKLKYRWCRSIQVCRCSVCTDAECVYASRECVSRLLPLCSSLSRPNRIPAAAAITTICTTDAVPLSSAERIYLTCALEILDRETRTLRFASAFLLSALLHLIIMCSGLGPLICDVFLPFLALLWNAACALARPDLAAWNGHERQIFINSHSLQCTERYSRDLKKK